jgi:hypothetical protein
MIPVATSSLNRIFSFKNKINTINSNNDRGITARTPPIDSAFITIPNETADGPSGIFPAEGIIAVNSIDFVIKKKNPV